MSRRSATRFSAFQGIPLSGCGFQRCGRAKWRPPPIRTGSGRRVRGQYTLRGHSIRRCSMRKSTHRLPGLILSNHEFILPLDHKKPNAEKITVFAREVVSVDHENKADLPWLVFFSGRTVSTVPGTVEEYG